eukprot:comp22381_c0_seq1/m.54260 comp22381_c0_seq1/g.54260  ORF comp22381_c0_seq1/g.54260 comp22381_c0_seq1/m.54260 type:complete len:566 (+) comp22381_c0_seq1:4079-5776(+)
MMTLPSSSTTRPRASTLSPALPARASRLAWVFSLARSRSIAAWSAALAARPSESAISAAESAAMSSTLPFSSMMTLPVLASTTRPLSSTLRPAPRLLMRSLSASASMSTLPSSSTTRPLSSLRSALRRASFSSMSCCCSSFCLAIWSASEPCSAWLAASRAASLAGSTSGCCCWLPAAPPAPGAAALGAAAAAVAAAAAAAVLWPPTSALSISVSSALALFFSLSSVELSPTALMSWSRASSRESRDCSSATWRSASRWRASARWAPMAALSSASSCCRYLRCCSLSASAPSMSPAAMSASYFSRNASSAALSLSTMPRMTSCCLRCASRYAWVRECSSASPAVSVSTTSGPTLAVSLGSSRLRRETSLFSTLSIWSSLSLTDVERLPTDSTCSWLSGSETMPCRSRRSWPSSPSTSSTSFCCFLAAVARAAFSDSRTCCAFGARLILAWAPPVPLSLRYCCSRMRSRLRRRARARALRERAAWTSFSVSAVSTSEVLSTSSSSSRMLDSSCWKAAMCTAALLGSVSIFWWNSESAEANLRTSSSMLLRRSSRASAWAPSAESSP